ncbi:hypothetical protein F5Y05DRAFT_416420 [Hypoxylon sp. FL0543]|nr:hypothetical protein F5Y05DRAFT_416420 [Hypoxylon sp. FL0543]
MRKKAQKWMYPLKFFRSMCSPDTDAEDSGDKCTSDNNRRREEQGKSESSRLRQSYFPDTVGFMDDMDKCLRNHPDPELTPYALEVLKAEHIERMKAWIKSNSPEILLIQWSGAGGAVDRRIRTTDLTLELIGIYQDVTSGTVLSHFCSWPAEQTNGDYALIIQDFIAQLLEKHADKFRHFHEDLTSYSSQETVEDTDRLWKLFEKCIVFAKPSSVAMMLDNVNSMYRTGAVDGPDEWTHDFYDRLKRLMEVLAGNGILSKVILTSRSPKTISYMKDVASSHIKISKSSGD